MITFAQWTPGRAVEILRVENKLPKLSGEKRVHLTPPRGLHREPLSSDVLFGGRQARETTATSKNADHGAPGSRRKVLFPSKCDLGTQASAVVKVTGRLGFESRLQGRVDVTGVLIICCHVTDAPKPKSLQLQTFTVTQFLSVWCSVCPRPQAAGWLGGGWRLHL